jgi:outer membrane protein assembly factor BamB
MVEYAQPLGWGVDKGVVIVRHMFPDGSTILSFYGHLDPPSVVLEPGDCVARNEQIGRIGKPRGSPHLHFEIRSHLPDTPGPGYWPVDPRRAGWQPPSQYIWDYRVKNSPGVMWTRFFTATSSSGLGYLQDGTFVVLDEQQLVGLDELDGSLRWAQPFEARLSDTVLDAEGGLVYAATRSGVVAAFEPPAPEGGNVAASSPQLLASRWQLTLSAVRSPELIPLPGGGVVVYAENRMLGLSATGEVLWQFDPATPPIDWAAVGDGVVMTTRDNPPLVRTANESGLLEWGARIGGRVTVSGDQTFVYDVDGIYRLRPESLSAELLYKLPRAYPGPGDIVALPDGGVLFAHGNLQDQRLLVLDGDGELRWQRSIARLPTSLLRLLRVGERAYAVMYDGDVYAIDAVDGTLTHIFDAGSRNPYSGNPWAIASGDQILIDFRGGNIVALDPVRALEAVSGATAAR